ncbi:MAG: redoxin family protein [Chloroflexi bacterium]|nr:redoxin family protein [Chloroflexota bacterium]
MRFPFVRSAKINILFLAWLALAVAAFSCAPRPASQPGDQAATQPDWLNIPLKDVNTGKAFQLSDFKGKIVVLETMAVWCTTCLAQQAEIKKAEAQFGDEVVSVSLDIDPNESEDILRKHAQGNGFGWIFAVSPRSVSQQLEASFGRTVLNPTSTPVIILDKDQSSHRLRSGVKSAAELVAEIARYR